MSSPLSFFRPQAGGPAGLLLRILSIFSWTLASILDRTSRALTFSLICSGLVAPSYNDTRASA